MPIVTYLQKGSPRTGMAKYVVARIMRPASDFRGGIVTNKKLARRLPDGASRSPTLQEYTMNKELYPIPESFADTAQVKRADYERMYAESVEDPERFWGRIGRRIDWTKEFSRVKDSNFAES